MAIQSKLDESLLLRRLDELKEREEEFAHDISVLREKLYEAPRDVYDLAKQVGLLVQELGYMKDTILRLVRHVEGNNGAASMAEQIRTLQVRIDKIEIIQKAEGAGKLTLRTELIRGAATLLGGGILKIKNKKFL